MSKNKVIRFLIFFFYFMVFYPIIIRAQARTIPLKDINPDKIGETFTVQGRIVNIIPPRSDTAPYSIYLTDDVDTLLVVVWDRVWKQIPFREQLKPDIRVIITGTLKEYRNNLNFYLTDADDIVLLGVNLPLTYTGKSPLSTPELVLDPPPGIFLPSRVDRSQMGQIITVQGVVRDYWVSQSETSPNSIFLQDESGSLRIVYWREVADMLDSENLPKPGQTFRIKGTVDEYRGELQLRVNNALDIMPVKGEESIPQSKPIELIPLASIQQSQKDQKIKVIGKIIDLNAPQNTKDPYKLTLMDNTGALVVLYNQDVAKSLKDNMKFEMGKNYEIKGQIIEDMGQLRLNLTDSSDIRLLGEKSGSITPESSSYSKSPKPVSQGYEDDPLELPINSISSDYLGLYVKTKGKIVSLTPPRQTTAPTVATLSYRKTKIDIVYWNDVAEKIPAELKLEVNKIIQITGKIREFRDELQIKIYKPEDIVLLSDEEASSLNNFREKETPGITQSQDRGKGTKAAPLIIPISDLTGELENKYVLIKGEITDIKPSWQPSAPNRVTLSDDKGKIVIVSWADVADHLAEEQKPQKGYTIQIRGMVSTYRDELQVKVSEPENIVIIEKKM